MTMKKKCLVIFLILLTSETYCQIVTIPDANFKSALVNDLVIDTNFDGIPDDDVDTNNDGEIQVSEAEAVHPSLFIEDKGIISLVGISSFTQLFNLYCANNQLVTLDVSQNIHLRRLECENNQLINLNITQNQGLEYLYCDRNSLTTLDISHNPNLFWLNCYDNELTHLDTTENPDLWYLRCFNNQLTNLDISQNPNMFILNCSENQLSDLNTTQNPNLNEIYCGPNLITSLDLSENIELEVLSIIDNPISTIDLSQNLDLRRLYCSNTTLTSLDLSLNPNLEKIDCSENQLLNLNIANGNNTILERMFAVNNPNLACINVDDINYANNQICDISNFTGWCKDSWTEYGENCNLGIGNTLDLLILELYPNPTSDYVKISNTNNALILSLHVYDLRGNLILKEKNSFEEINLTSLTQGIYLVKIKTKKGSFTHKLLKI